MNEEHIGVVSGLPDVVNFLASLKRYAGGKDIGAARVVLFGAKVSLPEKLQKEFDSVMRRAFPQCDLISVPIEALTPANITRICLPELGLGKGPEKRIVYGNSIHKPGYQLFYSLLKPDEFVFFDNGLSSYWDHDCDVGKSFLECDLPPPSMAYLSLHPPLSLPRYLQPIPVEELDKSDFQESYTALRAAARHRLSQGPLPSTVVLGTSLFRTKRISWEEERGAYLQVVRLISERVGGRILFKSHPRAIENPLMSDEDGVEVLDTIMPVEAFAAGMGGGRVYSVASTSLLTLQKFFGYTAFKIDVPAIRKVAETMPHLHLTHSLPSFT